MSPDDAAWHDDGSDGPPTQVTIIDGKIAFQKSQDIQLHWIQNTFLILHFVSVNHGVVAMAPHPRQQ